MKTKFPAQELKNELLKRLFELYLTKGSIQAAFGLLSLSELLKPNFRSENDEFQKIFAFCISDLMKRNLIKIYHSELMNEQGRSQVNDKTLIGLTHQGVEFCENKFEEKAMSSSINLANVRNSNIHINSDGNQSHVTVQKDTPEVFDEILSALEASHLLEGQKRELVTKVKNLQSSYQKGTYSESYKEFMQDLSAHITVFSPFLAGLSQLL